jgi:hypothetical protein
MRRFSLGFALVALGFAAQPAAAGPPITCHPIEIGDAASLPYGAKAFDTSSSYQISQLIPDTLRLLSPQTPVLVRMETLRRAAIYGVRDAAVASELAALLMSRALESERKGNADSLAWFDAGFLVEALKETSIYGQEFRTRLHATVPRGAFDGFPGYEWVQRAIELRGQDPDMEFAAALIRQDEDRASFREHLRRAADGAAGDPLLAKNLTTHFGGEADSLEVLRVAP